MVRRILIAVATTLILAGSALSQAAWQTVDGRVFTAEMPAIPAATTQQTKSGGGTGFHFLSWTLDHDGRAFLIQTATYPADVDVRNPNVNIKLALDASGRHLEPGKWDKVAWLKFQGFPAAEAIGKMNATREFRNLLVMKGRQFYSLGFAGPMGSLRSPDADRFFNSFRIR